MAGINRRHLLLGAAIVAAVPATIAVGTVITPHQNVMIAYLRHQLPGLAVSQIDLEGHARRFTATIPFEQQQFHYGIILGVMANPVLEATLTGHWRETYSEFTRRLMTGFLLSTDFFSSAGAEPSRTRYVAYRDPYELGCSNPLARPIGTA